MTKILRSPVLVWSRKQVVTQMQMIVMRCFRGGGNSHWKVDTDVPRKFFGHKQGDQYIIENGDPNTRQLITS